MGQYLVIGIATRVVAYKNRQDSHLTAEEVRRSLEMRFNHTGNYNVKVDEEGNVELLLKPEVAELEWEQMLRDFYELRYHGVDSLHVDFDEMRRLGSLDCWIEMAKTNGSDAYRMVKQFCFGYREEIDGWSRYIETSQDLLALSIDGKIIMECYGGILGFFTRLIRERLGKYRLSDSLFVEICG